MPVPTPEFKKIRNLIEPIKLVEQLGKVNQVVGLVVESDGPNAKIGDLCLIEVDANTPPIRAEVVGFRGDQVLLMPLGEMVGVSSGCIVRTTGHCLRVPVGDCLLGRVLDGLGEPLDDLGPLNSSKYYPVRSAPPSALERKVINEKFVTSVRAIDGLLTMGVGQRMGVFAGSGVGKSTLLGMIARNCYADINVIALVGERGREVREFIEGDLGEEGLKRSVIICATSDQPAVVRINAALTATAIAEYFRDKGLSVMLMMDSVTRFAMAQRELGLAVGEPPSTKGYTPSVFAVLPRLMERAGKSAKGSITAIYTILVEGDDLNEPIADTSRSILDGHIVLNRKLTSKGHYPPIDTLESLSRVMGMVCDADNITRANRFRELIAAYADVEELVSIGAYKHGSRPVADKAIAKWKEILAFLQQQKTESTSIEDTIDAITRIVG